MFKGIVIFYAIKICYSENAYVTSEAALDMAIDQKPIGRIVIGLFGEIVPKTVENFEALANHKV